MFACAPVIMFACQDQTNQNTHCRKSSVVGSSWDLARDGEAARRTAETEMTSKRRCVVMTSQLPTLLLEAELRLTL